MEKKKCVTEFDLISKNSKAEALQQSIFPHKHSLSTIIILLLHFLVDFLHIIGKF